jgi:hypothetical protein
MEDNLNFQKNGRQHLFSYYLGNGIRLQLFGKMEDNLNFKENEDDLNFNVNGRQPQCPFLWKTTSVSF